MRVQNLINSIPRKVNALVRKLWSSGPVFRVLIGGLSIVVLAGGIYGLYILADQPSDPKTIKVDGKTYTTAFYTTRNEQTSKNASYEPTKIIEELEKRVSDKPSGTYEEYETLGRMYMGTGNNEKAIVNFEMARTALASDREDFQSKTTYINNMIANLKKGSN